MVTSGFILLRWLLAVIFLRSSFGKLRDRQGFISIVLDYYLLPSQWAHRFALILPWAELAIGLLLLFGLGVKVAAGLSALLLLAFIIAIGLNLARGRKDLKCGCAGARRSRTISGKLLARNVALLWLAVLVMLWGQDSPLVWRFVGQASVFAVNHALRVGEGMPFTLTITGALMLALLAQQFKRFIRLEARR
jgi:uncharacterized membrane protein YphA (DoxX/SURF4 family)